jgi:hypothetical protein
MGQSSIEDSGTSGYHTSFVDAAFAATSVDLQNRSEPALAQ